MSDSLIKITTEKMRKRRISDPLWGEHTDSRWIILSRRVRLSWYSQSLWTNKCYDGKPTMSLHVCHIKPAWTIYLWLIRYNGKHSTGPNALGGHTRSPSNGVPMFVPIMWVRLTPTLWLFWLKVWIMLKWNFCVFCVFCENFAYAILHRATKMFHYMWLQRR